MNDISTLLWKEYHNNLYLIILGAVVLFLPAVLVFSTIVGQGEGSVTEVLAVAMVFGSVAGLILSQFSMLYLGGQLIAGERSAGTFEFLFNQPVSRKKIVFGKLLFAMTWLLAIWSLSGLMMLIGFQLTPPQRGPNIEFAGYLFFAEVAAVGLLMFGASWLASNLVENGILAMALGALATTAAFLAMQFCDARLGLALTIGEEDWLRPIVLFIFSFVTTTAGAILFTKRRSP